MLFLVITKNVFFGEVKWVTVCIGGLRTIAIFTNLFAWGYMGYEGYEGQAIKSLSSKHPLNPSDPIINNTSPPNFLSERVRLGLDMCVSQFLVRVVHQWR